MYIHIEICIYTYTHTHNEILFSHKEQSNVIVKKMDGTGDHHAK
jgi:hypothetical protein